MPNTTVPAPIVWQPSSSWDGNDGSWNTFTISVGTPPQEFHILPSTAGQETWIPIPAGCTAEDPLDPGFCGSLRGALQVDGVNSSGFEANASSTWQALGLYTLDAQEAELGYEVNGDYGLDTVAWATESHSTSLAHQVVAGIADPAFWLGVAGLGPKPSNFTNYDAPITSFLSTLVANGSIASLSWAYTAGASYRNRSPASLTLGGYDDSRMSSGGLSLAMNEDNSRPLQVGVQKILGTNTLSNSVNLLPTATYHFIDSTVPHIWMPSDSIDAFVSAFGLTYDNNTDLFLVNDTIHEKLQNLNPTITFVFSASTVANSGATQNIVLPYAAFDLKVGYPYYTNDTNYFPIRRAANSSQYTIGRTLLQETYLVADFGRSNFTIAQTAFTNGTSSQITAITTPQPNESSAPTTVVTSSGSPGKSLGTGAIVGIVIGVVGAFLVAGTLILVALRRRRAHRYASAAATDMDSAEVMVGSGNEKGSASIQVHELGTVDKPPLHELTNTTGIMEADGRTAKWGTNGVQELEPDALGEEKSGWGSRGVQELRAEEVGHEVEGNIPLYELAGSAVSVDHTTDNAETSR